MDEEDENSVTQHFVENLCDEDRRDLAIHDAFDHLVCKVMRANGFRRREVLERMLAFVENDDDAPPLIDASLAERSLAKLRYGVG